MKPHDVHVRVSDPIYRALRRASYEEEISHNEILTEALELRLASYLEKDLNPPSHAV